MKKFPIRYFAVLIASVLLIPLISCSEKEPQQMFYEIKIYSVPQPGQAERVDKYLAGALIPTLHKAGIRGIGIFKPIEADTAAYGRFVFVFIPYETADKYISMNVVLEKDSGYQLAGKDFLDAPFDNPPFARYESILLKAFRGMPLFRMPSFSTPGEERIYELRSYESATEQKAAKKRDMFNNGEIALFEKLEFNAVFYGQVLAGSHMPNLMYMTTFQDMKIHDEKWAAFGKHPDWIKMRDLEEYKNTVSRSTKYLLHPTSYSDF